MKKTTKNILGVAGIISSVLGITIAIPSFLNEMLSIATVSVFLIVIGLVLLAIAFGD